MRKVAIMFLGLIVLIALMGCNGPKEIEPTRIEPTTQEVSKPNQAQQVKASMDKHMGINVQEFCDTVVNELKIDFEKVPQLTDEWRGDSDQSFATYEMTFKDGSKLSIGTQDSKLCSVDYYGEDGKN